MGAGRREIPLLPSRPGGPENSLSYKELEVKFRTNTERTLPADRVEELGDALNTLDELDSVDAVVRPLRTGMESKYQP